APFEVNFLPTATPSYFLPPTSGFLRTFADSKDRMSTQHKPVIGITIGDLNGIGTELIIKTFGDHRILEYCTPVIFASNKVINFYRKSVPDINFNYQAVKELNRVNFKQINIFNCWEEEVNISPGQLTDTGGKYAIRSLIAGVQALKENKIQGLVTAP